jgi:hypothetical protein
MSEYFLAANGVKQGAVMSPVLFCVYIDELLISISKAGVGCYIGGIFVGAFAYADDIVIVAPSATALRRLLTICDDYAREYSIAFNAAKSKCLIILPSKCRWLQPYVNKCRFFIGNKPIELVNSFCHLGHIISNDLSDDLDIMKRRNDFIRQVNNVTCYFRGLTPSVKYKLFCSYCSSFYGCELWCLSMIRLTAFVQRGARVFAEFGTFRNIHTATSCPLYAIVCPLLMSSVVAKLILLNPVSRTNIILLDFFHCTLFFTHVVSHLLVRTLHSVRRNIISLYTNFLICPLGRLLYHI